jgi:hypothetical protein
MMNCNRAFGFACDATKFDGKFDGMFDGKGSHGSLAAATRTQQGMAA